MSRRFHSSVSLFTSLVCSLGLSTRATARVATFESYPEGEIGTSFVDVANGMTFRSPTYQFDDGPRRFSTDYSAAETNRPRTSPGNSLSSHYFSPGEAAGLTYIFGFTIDFAQPVGWLDFDTIGTSRVGENGTLTVTARGASGVLRYTQVIDMTNPAFEQHHIMPARPTNDIETVTFTARDLSIGYDNINTVAPEPMSVAGLLLLTMLRRRRHAVANRSATRVTRCEHAACKSSGV